MDFWSSFWDLIGWFLWITIFISYLFALVAIVTDLFRDRDLSGWGKAIWLFFLFFVPFLTALVYLIARGKGMTERNVREAQAAQRSAEDYIRSLSTASPADEISKAKNLLDSGVISAEEFEQIKGRSLAG
ncbi:SHOCT domain-containing protein [Cumulibacter soli]|uniref:SHOCT domain-containing protein n=1 Tax=Cumulibacter soli TaxID=2546344 RepID=UPI001067B9AC|nr:SHOCT domain-containing protein [Cumulibacter soli]